MIDAPSLVGVAEKRCSKCGNVYPATAEFFSSDKQKKDGLHSHCKKCVQIYHKVYYSRPDRQEHVRIYLSRPENKEHKRLYDQVYYSRPEVQSRARNSHYGPKYRERKRSYDYIYRRRPEYREQRRSYDLTYLSRKQAVLGNHTPEQIQEQLHRQKRKCYYCHDRLKKIKGNYIYHVDHTFPLSRVAGTDIPANDIAYLVITCPTCNKSKSDKFPWEFFEGGT